MDETAKAIEEFQAAGGVIQSLEPSENRLYTAKEYWDRRWKEKETEIRSEETKCRECVKAWLWSVRRKSKRNRRVIPLWCYFKGEGTRCKSHRNKARIAARMRKLRMSIPAWGNRRKIDQIYATAQEMGMEVDHIIPLKGKTVWGLHVENNLRIITSPANKKKGNKILRELFESTG